MRPREIATTRCADAVRALLLHDADANDDNASTQRQQHSIGKGNNFIHDTVDVTLEADDVRVITVGVRLMRLCAVDCASVRSVCAVCDDDTSI
jgi:hypothetical protein